MSDIVNDFKIAIFNVIEMDNNNFGFMDVLV